MDTREKMKAIRERKGLSVGEAAHKIGISETLLSMVENGAVTADGIVKRLQTAFGLTDIEAEELLPPNRRPHSPEYDPDKYLPFEEWVEKHNLRF